MAKIEGKCKEIFDKTEWVAIVTQGEDGPHLVATWGDYVRISGIEDDTMVIPAGYYNKTEQNLQKNALVQLLIASREVPEPGGQGQGCIISGRGHIQTSGEVAETMKRNFSWARGALVIKIEEVGTLL